MKKQVKIYFPSWQKVLMSIRDGACLMEIYKKRLDVGYETIVKLMKKFEEQELITALRTGRRKIINLTSNGLKMQENLINIKNSLK